MGQPGDKMTNTKDRPTLGLQSALGQEQPPDQARQPIGGSAGQA